MNRKIIKQTAREYYSLLPFMQKTEKAFAKFETIFGNGAVSYINSVWHKASEKPKVDNTILFANLAGGYELTVRFADIDWEMFCDNSGLVSWAYIEDLIPDEKGGKQ